MEIHVLRCGPGGAQTLETREVPDDYFAGGGAVSPPTPDEDRDALAIDHEYRLTLLELGVTEEV